MQYAPVPMHIPDGFVSTPVAVILWILSIAVIAVALKRVERNLGERQIPLMGVLAAAIFAGQMLNFAVAGGTSGHLMGAALATILLGPWAATIVLTCVVGVQALIFQDGGVLALGANIFNMGIVGVAVAYMTFTTIKKLIPNERVGLLVGGAVAAWLSFVIASLAAALELAASGVSPANIAIPAMGGIHALIGIGEALITVGALAFIFASQPKLLTSEQAGAGAGGGTAVWVGGLLIAVALAVASPLASSHPDGLEWVAEQQGFLSRAQAPSYNIIPDYVLPGIPNEAVATILAGIIGALIVFAIAGSVAYLRRNRQSAA